MKVSILFFGQLTDVTGVNVLALHDVTDTDSAIAVLHQRYPALAQSKYVVAVDQEVISGNTTLSENSMVALLPPFSGG